MTYPNTALELAELTDANGRLLTAGLPLTDPPVPSQVSVVMCDGVEWVAWRGRRHRAAPSGDIDALIRVGDARGVQSFVRRFGVLGFCHHGRIAGDAWHRRPDIPPATPARRGARGRAQASPDPIARLLCGPESLEMDGEHWFVEPVADYLAVAERVRQALGAAAELRRGLMPRPDAWDTLRLPFVPAPAELVAARRYLAAVVGDWLRDAEVSMTLDWEQPQPVMRFAGATYARLMLGLARAIASEDLELCAACGVLYPRGTRRAKRNQRSFCPDCRGAPAAALRQREARANRRTSP